MDKSYRIFVEGTRVMLTSRLAYENTPSLRRSIDKRLENSADRMNLVTSRLSELAPCTPAPTLLPWEDPCEVKEIFTCMFSYIEKAFMQRADERGGTRTKQKSVKAQTLTRLPTALHCLKLKQN